MDLCDRTGVGGCDALMRDLWRAKGSLDWDDLRNSEDGTTLLMGMVRDTKLNVISGEILLGGHQMATSDLGAVRDKQGDSILSHAVDWGNIGAVGLILLVCARSERERDALFDTPNINGDYPLAYAVHHKSLEMVNFLLFNGARVLPPAEGRPVIQVLHEAAGWDHDAHIFEALIGDLRDTHKYSSEEVDGIINRGTTYCEVHKKTHTLKDYLHGHCADKKRLTALVSELLHDRGLK